MLGDFVGQFLVASYQIVRHFECPDRLAESNRVIGSYNSTISAGGSLDWNCGVWSLGLA